MKKRFVILASFLILLAGTAAVAWGSGLFAGLFAGHALPSADTPPAPVRADSIPAHLLEDGWVKPNSETVNNGVNIQVKTRGTLEQTAYLKFEVTGVKGVVTSAILRLYATKSPAGKQVGIYAADNDWTEETLTWRDRPARRGDPLAIVVPTSGGGSYVDFDVTEYISGDGVFSFAVTGDSPDEFVFLAKQADVNPPLLEVSGDETVSRSPEAVTARGAQYMSRYSHPEDIANVGIFDVTRQPYGAKGDGVADDTLAIQRAVNEARDAQAVVFFPAGTYKVTDTLNAVQGLVTQKDIEGERIRMRAFPNVLTGPRQGQRAVLQLPPGTPGFGDAEHPKPLVRFWSRGVDSSHPPTGNQSANSYNQMLIDVDLDLGGNNAGAIGLDHAAAQGSAIEDVTIHAEGAYIGVKDLPGGGSGTHGVTVVGGQYGLYVLDGQVSLISDMTLTGQSVAAIYYKGNGVLQVVGASIEGARIIGATSGTPWSGNISLIDSVVKLTAPGTAIRTPRSVYIGNSYFYQAAALVDIVDIADKDKSYANQPGNATGWTYVKEYAAGTTVLQSPAWSKAATKAPIPQTATPVPVWVNGVKATASASDITNPYEGSLPADLQSRHAWTKPFPSWQDADAANVKTAYGAKGDGVADDTAAIQAAIDRSDKVFLPKGNYLISRPLALRANTKLFGIGNVQTQIIPIVTGTDTAFRDPAHPQPMISTVNDPEATTTLAFLNLRAPRTSNAVYAIHWQAGRHSIVRDADTSFGLLAQTGGDVLTHSLVVIDGNGGGRWYELGNAYGPNRNEGPAYRRLTVRDTTEPLTFYDLNMEHALGDYEVEFIHARNIDMFSWKTEGNKPLIKISDSRNIRMIGFGGNANPLPNTPSILVDHSEDFVLANIMFQQRPPTASSDGYAGVTVDPSTNYVVKEIASGAEVTTPGYEQVVLYKRGHPGE